MKRVKAACICQTLHFTQKDETNPAVVARQAAEEVEQYKKYLERTHCAYKVVDQQSEADGSITLKVIKQYNHSPVGDYL